ncbi:hypothetical protein H0H81_003872 [Sphagnurus paluster]|uniref:Uncharacterized protein n=1 Tax=Sphagnurus paluster TaxID=117069 RepID=A0A9P7K2A8_9AGAR|nr:hypothetical protein H0H81_003872 [Sphagnurus paluster]
MLYETHGTSTPNSTTTAFDVDQQIHPLEQQLRRIWGHELHNDVPALVSIAAPCKPASYVHELHQPAPVGSFSQPFPLPQSAKSNTTSTPVNLARAAAVPKPTVPVPRQEIRPPPAVSIHPPPDSRPSTPAQPTTLRTPPIDPAYTVGCRTPVPATPALTPITPSFLYSPVSPSPSDISKPTPFAPSPDHFTVQAPTKPPSFKSAPVGHLPPFFAAPLSAPAASSEEHAATHPRPPASSSTPAPPAPLKRQRCFV